MRTKIILAALGLIAIVLIGCSAVTPAPEVRVTGITPSLVPGTDDSAQVQVRFRNYNKIDAIINRMQFVFVGPIPPYRITQSAQYISFYLPGESDSLTMNVSITGLNNTRAIIGNPGYCTIHFWGSDAYGYNKTFTDSTSFGF